MDYIKRKCTCCGEFILINPECITEVIRFKNKFYHYKCFESAARTKSQSNNKKTKATWSDVLNNMSEIKRDTINALRSSIAKDEFNAYLLSHYDVVEVPRRLWQVISDLSNGTYKGMKCRPVSIDTVYDCWKWGQHKLDDINTYNKQNNKGPVDDSSRIAYDFAIIVNKIPTYMKEKAKEDNISNQIKKDVVSSNAINNSYINAIQITHTSSNDISSLVDEIF